MGRKRLYSDEERKQRAAASKERYRVSNPIKVKKSQQGWQMRTGWKRKKRLYPHSSPKVQQKGQLKKYGPNALEEWTTRLFDQEGLRKICGGQGERGKSKGLVMDHNHTTGKLRSLLCAHCNVGLGMFKEDVALMQVAINYLKADQ